MCVKNGVKTAPKVTKSDQKRAKTAQNVVRFALPILTFGGQIAPGGPETPIRAPKTKKRGFGPNPITV